MGRSPNEPDSPLVTLGWCSECGAQPGELCHRNGRRVSRVHAARLPDVNGIPAIGRCRGCRFVKIVPAEPVRMRVDDIGWTLDTGSKHFCVRYPPRRSLGDEFHLTQVDPAGWCGEFSPMFGNSGGRTLGMPERDYANQRFRLELYDRNRSANQTIIYSQTEPQVACQYTRPWRRRRAIGSKEQ